MSKTPTLQARRFASEAELRAAILACRFIRKDGPESTPWCVYSEAGERIACHETHEAAAEQLAAIEANKESDKSARQEDEPERQPQDELPQTPTIKRTEDGWRVESDEGTVDVDTRAEAFEVIEATDWFAQVTSQKHLAQFEGLAEGRWLDAASVEDLPAAHDGSQIRDQAITQMADNLAREKTPVMVDGGGVSEVHESVWNTAAKAAGWGFAAVRVEGDDGKPHLWLYAKLQPDVDEAVENRQLQFGSVAFLEETADRYTGEPIGARLISYALTNEPFVEGLEPHEPRSQRSGRASQSIAITRSKRIMANTQTSQRGEAMQALQKVAEMLGVSLEQEDGLMRLFDTLHSLEQAADAEQALESMNKARSALQAERETDEPDAEVKAEDDVKDAFESDEEMRQFAAEELRWWREVSGQPDLTAAQAASMRQSSTDMIKGALAEQSGNPDGLPSEQRPEGDSSGEKSMSEQAPTREGVQNEALRGRIAAVEQENKKLRERIEREDAEKAVDQMASTRKLQLTQDQREKFVRAVLSHGADEVAGWLDAINAPPVGVRTEPSRSDEPAASGPETYSQAMKAERDRIARENPQVTRAQAHRQAYEAVKSKYPSLLSPAEQ